MSFMRNLERKFVKLRRGRNKKNYILNFILKIVFLKIREINSTEFYCAMNENIKSMYYKLKIVFPFIKYYF